MSKTIWYIHGAYSTSRTFNWIRTQLPEHRSVTIDYSSHDSVKGILSELIGQANKEPDSFSVIGHSLGGILAVALTQRTNKVQKAVTLASPFGGCRIAAMLRYMMPGSLMDDVQPFSALLTEVRARGPGCPTMSIVTSSGSCPMLLEPNDGVVTVRSQMSLKGAEYVERNLNHFEVLLDPATAKDISDFLWT